MVKYTFPIRGCAEKCLSRSSHFMDTPIVLALSTPETRDGLSRIAVDELEQSRYISEISIRAPLLGVQDLQPIPASPLQALGIANRTSDVLWAPHEWLLLFIQLDRQLSYRHHLDHSENTKGQRRVGIAQEFRVIQEERRNTDIETKHSHNHELQQRVSAALSWV